MPADAPDTPGPAELSELEQRLMTAERAVRHWTIEATLRASTVAGALTLQVLAAEKLATAAEHLLATTFFRSSELVELQDAVTLYRDSRRGSRPM